MGCIFSNQAAIFKIDVGLCLNAEGLTKTEIANQIGVGEATVYRVLAQTIKN